LYVDLFEPLLHEAHAVSLIPDVDYIFFPLIEELIAMHPGTGEKLLVEDDLLFDLGGHGGSAFHFSLHHLVLLEEAVEVVFEVGKVVLLLFSLCAHRFHGLEGDTGEGAAVGGLVGAVVEDAHFTTVSEVGLDFAFQTGSAIYYV
jgi:hypothetical protein